MEVCIIEKAERLRVVIECRCADADILRLKSHIALFDYRLAAEHDGEKVFVNTADVLYFESVDDATFLYTDGAVFEIKKRLYELETALSERDFLRISKSVVVNLQRIVSLRPQLNRTILATMTNGERLVISRGYVKKLRGVLPH